MVVLSVRSSSSVEDTAVEEVDESEGVRQCEMRIGFGVIQGIVRARCGPAKDIMLGIAEVMTDELREGSCRGDR